MVDQDILTESPTCNTILTEGHTGGMSGFLTIRVAAKFLGVSPATLRRWDQRGKLPAYRHPINNYRLYRKEDLDELLSQIKRN